jgi:mono/diheme cytochrome c family protein
MTNFKLGNIEFQVMNKLIVLIFLILGTAAFTRFLQELPEEKPVYIPPSPQRTGSAALGYSYLITGDYLKSGIPYDYFKLGIGTDTDNFLKREGLNSTVGYDYTVVKASNGENVVAPNCLQCHAQIVEGKLYIGLGNTGLDFSNSQKLDPKKAEMAEIMLAKTDRKKFEAAEPFLKVVKAIGNQLQTKVRGVNAADRLAAVLAAHRDPNTFKWTAEASLNIPVEVIPTDVPAWWLLKKKHAMFYNGFGRGDFGRFLMASNLLTVNDTAESREVDGHFNDVLAYIFSLEPPKYPFPLDKALVKEGGILYIRNCSSCHGNYGNEDQYPNLLIPESIIKTDSLLLTSNYQNAQFINWFNSSWFAQGDHPARLEPFDGYIAPPLDGIWITAPYLHNGSVPTLEEVLNSKSRPKYWSRDFNNPRYDYQKAGWKYTLHDSAGGNPVYNTTLPGYGNYGHNFGDHLTAKERRALVAYLKTL